MVVKIEYKKRLLSVCAPTANNCFTYMQYTRPHHQASGAKRGCAARFSPFFIPLHLLFKTPALSLWHWESHSRETFKHRAIADTFVDRTLRQSAAPSECHKSQIPEFEAQSSTVLAFFRGIFSFYLSPYLAHCTCVFSTVRRIILACLLMC